MRNKIKKHRTPPLHPSFQVTQEQRILTQHYDHQNRRFLTSKQDDNYSACPSIEKELPELAIGRKDRGLDSTSPQNMSDNPSFLQDLMAENTLKVQAVQKANQIITLLREENADLSATVEELEIVVREKDRTIEQLEAQIFASQEGKGMRRKVFSEREREHLQPPTQRTEQRGRQTLTPREGVKTKTDIFFEFAATREK